MANIVIMPKQGLQMTEGTIVRWLISEGSPVKKGESLFEMETDKLTITMDAEFDGTLLKIIHQEGDVVPITQPIAIIGEPGEDISALVLSDDAGESAAPSETKAADNATDNAADFDVAVIGGGPGGYVCAIKAAKLGKKVILAEKRDLGGTCLNRGCIPTKALLRSAEVYEELLHAAELGLAAENVSFDYAKIADRKKKTVTRLRGGVAGLLKGNGVTVVSGKAVLTGKDSFSVDGKSYRAANIVLASGSFPAKVPIPGADKQVVMDSDGVLELEKCPESVVIVGGGVIGIEFATLFNTLGVKVSVIEMLPNIMTGMDDEICDAMKALLMKKGVDIHTGAKVLRIEDGLNCVYEENGAEHRAEGEIVVIAVGRRPDTADMGLAAAGVAMERGFVTVDEGMRTNVPGIYAIGDITGKIQLAHVASAQGIVAAENTAGGSKKMRYDRVPACIYTTPEIASAGLTEAKAKETGKNVKIGKFPISGNGRSMIMGESNGFVKIISDAKTGEIYGAHIMAPRATDMIGEIVVAMEAEATIEEIAGAIHPHPTVSEAVMEAAEDTFGMSCHKL